MMALVVLLCAIALPTQKCTYWTSSASYISPNDMTLVQCTSEMFRMNVAAKQTARALVSRGENVRVFCENIPAA